VANLRTYWPRNGGGLGNFDTFDGKYSGQFGEDLTIDNLTAAKTLLICSGGAFDRTPVGNKVNQIGRACLTRPNPNATGGRNPKR
jgi:hypothetical protein